MKALLVSNKYNDNNINEYIEELKSLTKACHIEVADVIIQNVHEQTPNYYIGKGKAIEISHQLQHIDMVIFNEELSPLQIKNLTDLFQKEVIDRSDLILRIFESRAKSKEAKIQVKIAKMEYMLPRLKGYHENIYSQQGGLGFRGSGETQIELDKRKIRKQISYYQKELNKIVKIRENQRKKRNKSGIKKVSIVGYTNSGKSSLLNYFSTKKVYSEDMLFASLETSSRLITLNNKQKILMTDTVGFINHLPHHLIKAFRSTLEEIKEADLLIEMIDASSEYIEQHMTTTQSVLEQLGVKDIPVLYVYNKMDQVNKFFVPQNPYVMISIKDNNHLDELQEKIINILFKEYVEVSLFIPYSFGEDYQYLKLNYNIVEKFKDNGIFIDVRLSPKDYQYYKKYVLIS